MNLLSVSEVPVSKNSMIFRASCTNYVILLIFLLFLMPLLAGFFGSAVSESLEVILYLIIACYVVILCGILYFRQKIIRSLWVVVLEKSGVYLKYPGPVCGAVLFVPLHEIKSVRKTVRTIKTAAPEWSLAVDNGMVGLEVSDPHTADARLTCLDVCLREPIMPSTNRQAEDSFFRIFKFLEKNSSQITLCNPSTIRIRFNNIKSPLIAVIPYFHRNGIKIDNDKAEDGRILPGDMQAEKIAAQMIFDGQQQEAVRFVQKVYGFEKEDAERMTAEISKHSTNVNRTGPIES